MFTEDDESHREMTLRKMLDAAEDFYVLNFRPEWQSEDRAENRRMVPVCCTCKYGYKWTLCGHSSLLCMIFDEDIQVPALWDQTSPSLRKARGRRGLVGVGKGRGVAGMKRTNLERVIEQDKQAGVRKAKAMRVTGPVLLPIPFLFSVDNACVCRRGK